LWLPRLTHTPFQPWSLGPLGFLTFFDLFQKVSRSISKVREMRALDIGGIFANSRGRLKCIDVGLLLVL